MNRIKPRYDRSVRHPRPRRIELHDSHLESVEHMKTCMLLGIRLEPGPGAWTRGSGKKLVWDEEPTPILTPALPPLA